MKLQEIVISDTTSDTPLVELTIADMPNIEDASAYIVAKVRIDRKGRSFENVQLEALRQLNVLIHEAAAPIEKKIRELP